MPRCRVKLLRVSGESLEKMRSPATASAMRPRIIGLATVNQITNAKNGSAINSGHTRSMTTARTIPPAIASMASKLENP